MNDFVLKTMVLGVVQTNTYIISNRLLKEAIIIDPADSADKLEQYLKANDLECKGILLTHGHFDHILAAKELKDLVGAPIYAHEKEEALLNNPQLNASSFIKEERSLKPEVLLKSGETIQLAGFIITIIHTPGHTAGGVCYYFEDFGELFSGDTLFFEDIGRSDLPTGNHKQLVESIKQKLMPLKDEVRVYPGHGQPTTIGHERKNNVYISADAFWE